MDSTATTDEEIYLNGELCDGQEAGETVDEGVVPGSASSTTAGVVAILAMVVALF